MKALYLLRGLPGCGKTTLAEQLTGMAPIGTAAMFAADDFFTQEDGRYGFDPKRLPQAHVQCQVNVKLAMAQYLETIVVHNTCTTEWEIKPYLDLADEFGYQVFSLVVENRHGNRNIHDVPEEALARMRGRFSIQL